MPRDFVEELLKYDIIPAQRDERGLMPLDQARAALAALTPETAPASMGQPADRVWMAVLSFADAEEAIREMRRLRWENLPRGMDNVALHQRYGDAIFPWVAERFDRERRTLRNAPWNVIALLTQIATPEAFAIAYETDTIELPTPDFVGAPEKLLPAYLAAQPDFGWAELGRRVLAGEARAVECFAKLARGKRAAAALDAIEKALGPEARKKIGKGR